MVEITVNSAEFGMSYSTTEVLNILRTCLPSTDPLDDQKPDFCVMRGFNGSSLVIEGFDFTYDQAGRLIAGTITSLTVYGPPLSLSSAGIVFPDGEFIQGEDFDAVLKKLAAGNVDAFGELFTDKRQQFVGGGGNDECKVFNLDTNVTNDTARTGAGNDTVALGNGIDRAFLGLGNDTAEVFCGFRNDIENRCIFDGGKGRDTLLVSSFSPLDGVTIDLAVTTLQDTGRDSHRFLNFENITGGFGFDTLSGTEGRNVLKGDVGNDTLNGRGGNDQLEGGFGSDTLSGGTGDDTLSGGVGNDSLAGGEGADRFLFQQTIFGKDTIHDFEDGIDRLSFRGLGFNAGSLVIQGNGTSEVTISTPQGTIVLFSGAGPGATITIDASDCIF